MSQAIAQYGTGSLQITDKAAVKDAFTQAVETIPLADSDGTAMLGAILNITDVTQLVGDELISKLPNAEAVAGRKLRIQEVTRIASTIETEDEFSTGWYAVITSTDIDNGEQVIWQTSSRTPLAKIAMINAANAFPATVMTNKADKATKSGRFPINLIVLEVTKTQQQN